MFPYVFLRMRSNETGCSEGAWSVNPRSDSHDDRHLTFTRPWRYRTSSEFSLYHPVRPSEVLTALAASIFNGTISSSVLDLWAATGVFDVFYSFSILSTLMELFLFSCYKCFSTGCRDGKHWLGLSPLRPWRWHGQMKNSDRYYRDQKGWKRNCLCNGGLEYCTIH